jgi:hypothetical protein
MSRPDEWRQHGQSKVIIVTKLRFAQSWEIDRVLAAGSAVAF